MGWLMMAPLARPRRAQRQEVVQGGDEIAPTVDVGVAAVVGGHALDLRHGRQLRVQDRQIGLPGDGRGEQRLPLVEITYANVELGRGERGAPNYLSVASG
jgi:hypothetical protein